MRLFVKLLRNDLTGETLNLILKLEGNSQRSTEKKETWPLNKNVKKRTKTNNTKYHIWRLQRPNTLELRLTQKKQP